MKESNLTQTLTLNPKCNIKRQKPFIFVDLFGNPPNQLMFNRNNIIQSNMCYLQNPVFHKKREFFRKLVCSLNWFTDPVDTRSWDCNTNKISEKFYWKNFNATRNVSNKEYAFCIAEFPDLRTCAWLSGLRLSVWSLVGELWNKYQLSYYSIWDKSSQSLYPVSIGMQFRTRKARVTRPLWSRNWPWRGWLENWFTDHTPQIKQKILWKQIWENNSMSRIFLLINWCAYIMKYLLIYLGPANLSYNPFSTASNHTHHPACYSPLRHWNLFKPFAFWYWNSFEWT